MTGRTSESVLMMALERLKSPELAGKLHALEPANRWGTVEDAIIVVRRMFEASREYPDNVWNVR